MVKSSPVRWVYIESATVIAIAITTMPSGTRSCSRSSLASRAPQRGVVASACPPRAAARRPARSGAGARSEGGGRCAGRYDGGLHRRRGAARWRSPRAAATSPRPPRGSVALGLAQPDADRRRRERGRSERALRWGGRGGVGGGSVPPPVSRRAGVCVSTGAIDGGRPSAVSSSVQKDTIDWVRARGSTARARANARSTASETATPTERGVGRRVGIEGLVGEGADVAAEDLPPRQHLDHGEGQAEDVGPRADLPVALGQPLLGRGVPGGEGLGRVAGGDGAGVELRGAHGAGDAEVEDLHHLAARGLGHEDVLGLDVAVDDHHRPLRARHLVGLRQRARRRLEEGAQLADLDGGLAARAARSSMR